MTPEEIAALLQQPSKQQALLNALRGQKSLGFVGQASGDRVLSGLGAGLVQDAGAQEAADFRQRQFTLEKALAAARAREAQQAALAEEERRRQQHLDDQKFQAGQNDLTRQNTLRAAAIGAGRVDNRRAEDMAREDSQKLEADVQKLSKELGGNPALISEKMARIRGVVEGSGDVPGVGRFEGRLPEFVQSEKGLAVQADAKELVNTLLFMQSGAGVSNQERENKYKSYGIHSGASEEQFRSGMKRLENDMAKEIAAKEAAFRPEVLKTYKSRGGVTSKDVSGVAPSGPIRMKFPNGKVYPVDASEIDAARRRGGVEVPE